MFESYASCYPMAVPFSQSTVNGKEPDDHVKHHQYVMALAMLAMLLLTPFLHT